MGFQGSRISQTCLDRCSPRCLDDAALRNCASLIAQISAEFTDEFTHFWGRRRYCHAAIAFCDRSACQFPFWGTAAAWGTLMEHGYQWCVNGHQAISPQLWLPSKKNWCWPLIKNPMSLRLWIVVAWLLGLIVVFKSVLSNIGISYIVGTLRLWEILHIISQYLIDFKRSNMNSKIISTCLVRELIGLQSILALTTELPTHYWNMCCLPLLRGMVNKNMQPSWGIPLLDLLDCQIDFPFIWQGLEWSEEFGKCPPNQHMRVQNWKKHMQRICFEGGTIKQTEPRRETNISFIGRWSSLENFKMRKWFIFVFKNSIANTLLNTCIHIYIYTIRIKNKNIHIRMYMYVYIYIRKYCISVVPHKAVAEVSNIGQNRTSELLWCMDGRANPLMDRKVLAVATSPTTAGYIYLSVCLSIYLSLYLSICKLENDAILRDSVSFSFKIWQHQKRSNSARQIACACHATPNLSVYRSFHRSV